MKFKNLLLIFGFITIAFTSYSCLSGIQNDLDHLDGIKVTELDFKRRANTMFNHLEKELLSEYSEFSEGTYHYDWDKKWEEKSNNVVAINVTYRFTANNPVNKVRFGRCEISGVLRIAKDENLVYFQKGTVNEHLKKVVKDNAWDIFNESDFGVRIKYPK